MNIQTNKWSDFFINAIYFLIIFSSAIFILLSIPGCSSFSSQPPKVIEDDVVFTSIKAVTNPTATTACINRQTIFCRNNIIYANMLGIDINFSNFIDNLAAKNNIVSTAATITTLGLNAASTIYGGQVLSALSAAVIGGKEAYLSGELMDKTVTAVQTQMHAQRIIVKTRILLGMKQSIIEYPLALALLDLQNYFNAGTLLSAYSGLVTDAGIKVNTAIAALEKVTSTNYIKTATSEVIHNYLIDSKHQVISANVAHLDAWLEANNVGFHSSAFINASGDEMEAYRKKAITDLNIPK